jgi:hypothetical protein
MSDLMRRWEKTPPSLWGKGKGGEPEDSVGGSIKKGELAYLRQLLIDLRCYKNITLS